MEKLIIKYKLFVIWLIAICIFAVFPLMFPNLYIMRLMILCGINTVIVCGLNIVSGYGGQWSLAQSGFYAIGAYGSALTIVSFGIPIWASAIVGIILSGICGGILGIISMRVKGLYLAMISLCVAFLIELILSNWMTLTRGPSGITGIPSFFGKSAVKFLFQNYYVVLVILNIMLLINYNLVNSIWGLKLQAVRDNEIVAKSSGIEVDNYKITAFVISAIFAGIAGILYAHISGYISPDVFT